VTSHKLVTAIAWIKVQVERGNRKGVVALGCLAALLAPYRWCSNLLVARALPASPNPPRATQPYFENTP
jgi:hypothetical protein